MSDIPISQGGSGAGGGSTSLQAKSDTKAPDVRGQGQVAQQAQQAQQAQGQLSPWDPSSMRLGFGNWDNWGFLQPSLLDQPFSTMLEPFGLFGGRSNQLMSDMMRVPTMDLNETDKSYSLTVDLPGVPKEKVKVDLNGRTLTLSAERKEEQQDERSYRRTFGTFSRSLVLPENSDLEKIDAKYEHGQLKLNIPKVERKEDRRNIRIA